MQTERKVILSVVMIVLTALFVGLSVFSVLAAEKQNVETAITVNYNAPSIDATVNAYHTANGGFEPFASFNASGVNTGNDYLSLNNGSINNSAGSLRLLEDIDFVDSVVIRFGFSNKGTVGFTATLTTQNPTLTNVTLSYSNDNSTYSTTTSKTITVAAGNTNKVFYVKATVIDPALPAKFTPKFNWKITKI